MNPPIPADAILRHARPFRLAVVCGGPSPEAEVSRASSLQVVTALVGVGHFVELFEYGTGVLQELMHFAPDAVFPIMHGGPGEDGTFQGALELLGFSYVGSGVLASSLAMHKPSAKLVFKEAGLRVIDGVSVKGDRLSGEDIIRTLGSDLVAKPADEGSGLGVVFCSSLADLNSVISEARQIERELVVERRVVGIEVTVGVLETASGSHAFTPIEVATPEGSWYDFEHRYTPGLSDHVIPARLPEKVLNELKSTALRAHQALGCRDLSRSDFIVDQEGVAFLLEVNSLPGMTATSLYPDGAADAGISFPELLDHFACRSVARGRLNAPC